MAQASSQIRSSASIISFGSMIQIFLWSIILLPILGIFIAPKADGTVSLQSTPRYNAPAPTTSSELNHRFLQEVLQKHPKKEVAEVFEPKIAAHDIRIRKLSDPNASGRFEPMPVIGANGHLVKLMGTLFLSRDLLDRARRGDAFSKSYLDMVLLHESVHYEQIASGRFSAEIISLPQTTPESCVAGWHLEREAYFRECQFAMSIGQSKIIAAYCTTLDPKAFDDNLYKLLKTKRTDNCPAFWLNALNK